MEEFTPKFHLSLALPSLVNLKVPNIWWYCTLFKVVIFSFISSVFSAKDFFDASISLWSLVHPVLNASCSSVMEVCFFCVKRG